MNCPSISFPNGSYITSSQNSQLNGSPELGAPVAMLGGSPVEDNLSLVGTVETASPITPDNRSMDTTTIVRGAM